VWGLKTLPQNTKYLGVPLFLSQNKKKDFSYVKDRLESKTSGWKSNSLSWMGRATLSKSVALAIPNYSMTAFQLPKSLCEEMDSLLKKFWWPQKKNPLTIMLLWLGQTSVPRCMKVDWDSGPFGI
jgi:hypothetical protein